MLIVRKFRLVSLCLLLSVFVTSTFCTSVQVATTQEKTGKEELLHELKFIFDEVINQDFVSTKDKELATRLKFELEKKYELLDAGWDDGANQGIKRMLLVLITLQENIHFKLEVLMAGSNLNRGFFISLQEWKSLKLNLFYQLYELIFLKQDFFVHVPVDNLPHLPRNNIDINRFIKRYLNFQIPEDLEWLFDSAVVMKEYRSGILDYMRVVSEYRRGVTFTDDLLNQVNDFLAAAYAGKLEAPFDKRAEFIEFFIENLIKIKTELEDNKKLLTKLKLLNEKQRELMIRHLLLINDPVNDPEFFRLIETDVVTTGCFEEYNKIVDQYINSVENDSLFSYKLLLVVDGLKKLKSDREPSGLFALLGIKKDKKVLALCSFIERMIQNLEYIDVKIKEISDGTSGGHGIVEKILSGDIKVPEKVKNLAWNLVQSVMG